MCFDRRIIYSILKKRNYFKCNLFKLNMEKKKGVRNFYLFAILLTLFLTLVILSINFSSAQTINVTGQAEIERAYNWLGYKVGNWNALNVKDHSFALLALRCRSSGIDGLNQLKAKKIENSLERCWDVVRPATGNAQNTALCDLLSTSLAKIAIDSFSGENTSKVDVWIMNQSKFFSELSWFMQLDTERGYSMNCTIEYNNRSDVVRVNADKTISFVSTGTAPCFTLYPSSTTGNSYWLQLNGEACYKNSYKIKCDINDTTKTFKVNMLYKTDTTLQSTWYVAPEIYSEISGKEVEIHAESYCLKARRSDSVCNYEATAWATYALKKSGNSDYKKFIPYLVIKSLDSANKKYFYQALLYNIGISTYSQEITDLQNRQGFWKMSETPYGQFYDTALGGLTGIGNLDDSNAGGARHYLLNNPNFRTLKVGTNNYRYWLCTETGCSDLRDTAFILWSLWPGLCGGLGTNCVDHNFECRTTCDFDQDIVYNLTCPNYEEVCCVPSGTTVSDCSSANGTCKTSCDSGEYASSIFCADGGVCCLSEAYTSCSIMGGIPCYGNERCFGTEVNSLDGTCCLGTCIPIDSQNRDCESDLGGIICNPRICIDSSTWRIIEPIQSLNSNYCCVSNNIIKCVQDRTCSQINGRPCLSDEQCSGSTEETTDEKDCCTAQCLKRCSSLGGDACDPGEKCSGGIMEDSAEGDCCVGGTCKKPANLTWLWILIIILIIAGAGFALYWFKFRKKGEEKQKPGEKPSPFAGLFAKPTLKQQTQPQQRVTRPVATQPQTAIVRPSAVQQVPRTTININNQPKKIPKTKTDEELEKTLKKLKSMTKEKKR